jgi:thiamine-monophosphate kinase
VVESDAIPIHPGARAWFERPGLDEVCAAREAITGGEDYELLFAVPPRRRRAFMGAMSRCAPLAATKIGRLTGESGVWLHRPGLANEPLPAGFAHFGVVSGQARG